jgi:hypothetical protein
MMTKIVWKIKDRCRKGELIARRLGKHTASSGLLGKEFYLSRSFGSLLLATGGFPPWSWQGSTASTEANVKPCFREMLNKLTASESPMLSDSMKSTAM